LTGNNVNMQISYDPATKRPKDVVTKLNMTDAVQKWHYDYDHAGNLLKITDIIAGGNSQSYTYDQYNRITSATGLYGLDKKQTTETYGYTDGGRLTHKANLDLFYEDAKHLHAATRAKVKTALNTTYDVNYQYDDAGNMVQRDDEIFKYDSENKLVKVDKTVGDTVNYLYEHTGNRIRKSRTSTNEVVYNINGVYEVTKIPSMSDRHTLYIRGIKEELVAQYTATDVVLLTDSSPTNENKADIALLISSFKNKLDQTRIQFAKWVTRTTYENPFALNLYAVYIILFCLLLYAVTEALEVTTNSRTSSLRLVSLLLIVSVSFLFSNCSPKALTGGNRPQTPPYWLFGAFGNEPASESVSTGGGNNPASPSSGFGGSGGGSLSAGTPRLGMYFFHPDHTGSISMVTDGAGRMMTDTSGASQLTYKPYGEVNRMNSYGPDIFRYKYTSQQDDQDTGLYYYNARYYDPVLGSFTSADNVTNATSSFGLNHYMYTEGNPVRYGDASGNFLGPLLYSMFAQAMTYAAAAYAISSYTAIVSTFAAFSAINTLSTMMTIGSYIASAAVGAVRFAAFYNALGVVGAGVGFVVGGVASGGNLQGALAGAEIGFKIGTGMTIAAGIVVGAAYIGGMSMLGMSFAQGIGALATTLALGNAVIAAALGYILTFTIGGLYGELAKAIGRNAGGVLDPSHKGFKYNRKSAYRGEAAGDFINTSGQLGGGLWDATKFTTPGPIRHEYHSLDEMGAEIVGQNSFYFTENILGTIFKSTVENAVWAEMINSKPHTFGSY
jgi:RHS repeat-associated protein